MTSHLLCASAIGLHVYSGINGHLGGEIAGSSNWPNLRDQAQVSTSMNRYMSRGLVAAAAVLSIIGAGELIGQSNSVDVDGPRTIRVAGAGEANAEPDLATVHFAVETTGRTAQEAGQANANAMDRVIRALIEAGITREDIRTSGYGIHPEYAQQTRNSDPMAPPQIRGYRAMNQLTARTTDLDRVGRLIDAGLDAGANRMDGVNFELRNSAAAEGEALEEAVAEARRSAETIARTLGVRLGAVLDASTSALPPQPMYRRMGGGAVMEAQAVSAPSTPIEPGQTTVYANAALVFEIIQ
jgi:uncharacterized protein